MKLNKICRFGSVLCAVVGSILIIMYMTAVIPLYIYNAADKSYTFWYLVLLLGGILLWKWAIILWRQSKENKN